MTATDLPVEAGGGAASGTRIGRALGAMTPSGRASVLLSWALRLRQAPMTAPIEPR